ncbi:transmembrane protein 131 [Lamellibrachia satsuma]|nr:transmembrane protein 131 [Lamellibrachia satsuma]
MLDFQEQFVGMPHMEQVTVHNPDTQNSLHLFSISGSTLHFHCSFFQHKAVPPNSNTTFEVVFLARQDGNVENTLYIHTSQGSFKYQVFGVGVPNPYRVRPFLGAKVPINSSFSPLINLHNPHSSTLQVEEIYTSGDDLHLELPTGEREATKDMWEIPPYETKPIMKASFVARLESNHTVFIRIRTNKEKLHQKLVLPVEVEVTSVPGLFSPLELLDFGMLRTLDEPKTLQLKLMNSGNRHIHITNVTISPPNSAISIDFRPIQLKPDVLQPVIVAFISFTASKALDPKQWSGKIIIRSKHSEYKICIPYQTNVLHGSLVYERNKTMFYTGWPIFDNVTHQLPITNTFNFTVVIYNVSLPADAHHSFSIRKFVKPVAIPVQQTLPVLTLTFHPNRSSLHFSTFLFLHTNVSLFKIPLLVYNGHLKVVHHRPEIFQGQLDFGTLGMHETRNMTFTLRNENPVEIFLERFRVNLNGTQVQFLGSEKGNGTTLARSHNTSGVDMHPLILKPHHFAVFRVNLISPSTEGAFASDIVIVTQFQNVYIPITLRTVEGSLNALPGMLLFEHCFPGKICSHDLRIYSSFKHFLEVRDILFSPNDTRFYYVPRSASKAVFLQPQKTNHIGKIYFNMKKECEEDCYVGLPTSIPAGHHWLLGATLDKDVADIDQYLYTRFRQKWDDLSQTEQTIVNMTIQLDTNEVRGFLFSAQTHLHWPSISRSSKIKFPLTQIGNISFSEFVVENPGDVPVIVQVLPLSLYPNPQMLLDLVGSSITYEVAEDIETDDQDVFVLPDLGELHMSSNTEVKLRKGIENTLGVTPHRRSMSMILDGGAKIRIRVGFQPKDEQFHSSLIIIRNNLTIVETVVVQGQGGCGELRFGNRKASSVSPLLFDMTEKHLKYCDRKRQSKSIPPNFTVRGTFTARNVGQLPFYVHGFSINDSPCVGYGFKVLECHGFELAPNSSKKIDIAFTPDFTMSRVLRMLKMSTSLGPVMNFTLQASIPVHMLSKCTSALPRPTWEPLVYYSTVCAMVFLLVGVLVAVYFDADRILAADIVKRQLKQLGVSSGPQGFDKSKIFDLKTIAGVRTTEVTSIKAAIRHTMAEIGNGHITPTSGESEKKFWNSGLSSILTALSPRKSQLVANGIQKSTQLDIKSSNSGNNLKSTAAAARPSDEAKTTAAGGVAKEPAMTASLSFAEKIPRLFQFTGSKKQSNKAAAAIAKPAVVKKDDLIADTLDKSSPQHQQRIVNNNNINKRKLSEQEIKSSGQSRLATDKARLLAAVKKADPPQLIEVPSTLTELTFLNVVDDYEEKTKEAAKKKHSVKKHDERKRREHLLELEKEETSSTTTESSGVDPDEKNYTVRDLTPDQPQSTKTQKLKKRNKKEKKLTVEDVPGTIINEDEFIITSKSKAHKKIKIDPKNAFGGNILRPSTLELPYTTKLEVEAAAAAARDEQNKDAVSSNSLAADAGLRKQAKTKKIKVAPVAATKGVLPWQPPVTLPDVTVDDHRSSDSPPPLWDSPTPQPGDLSELALQTEQFSKKLSKMVPLSTSVPVVGSTSGLADVSQCGGSYSSIVNDDVTPTCVSGAGLKTAGNARLTSTTDTVGNIGQTFAYPRPTASNAVAPRVSLMSNELKHPGTIGTKACGVVKPTSPVIGSLRRTNPWNPNPGSPVTPDSLMFNNGLQPVKENVTPAVSAATMQPNVEPSCNSAYIGNAPNSVFNGLQNGLGQFGFAAAGADHKEMTMMQKLQLERRQRRVQYQNNLIKGEDWPGFGNGPSSRGQSLGQLHVSQ